MATNDTTDSGEGEQETRLIEVFARKRRFSQRKGILHRIDEESRCGCAPEPRVRTDLATAAVGDHDHNLCDRCDWPVGAEEVLHG